MSESNIVSALQRQSAILSLLDRQSSVQVVDLADLFNVSKVTIRKDLDELENKGKLRRTHGGAVSLSKRVTVSIQDKRVNVNVGAKKAIARCASEFVDDGDVLLVDSGTTALEFVRMLSNKQNITIITGDFTIADMIDKSMPNIDVVMLGGSLRKGHRYTAGPVAMKALSMLHADKAFVCPTSYVPTKGFLTNYPGMAELKSSFIRSCKTSFLLMDTSKVMGSGLIRFADISDVDFIIMEKTNDIVSESLLESNTKLIVAN